MTIRSKSTRTRLESQSLAFRLSITQRSALVNTWRILKQQQIGPLIKRIFQDLEVVSPKVKELFVKATYVDCFARIESKDPPAAANSNATLEDHIKLLARFLDELIMSVETVGLSHNDYEEEDPMSLLIKKVGQQHGKLMSTCGFQADIWEHLGEIMMERICASDPVQKVREAGRAWRTLIAYVTDKLRCGFEGEAKTCSRKPSRVYFSTGSSRADSCQGQENGSLTNAEEVKQLAIQLQNLRTSTSSALACDNQECDNCLR